MATTGTAKDNFSGRSRYELRLTVTRDAVSGNTSRYDWVARVYNLDGSSATWAADPQTWSGSVEGTAIGGSSGDLDFRDGAAYHTLGSGTTPYKTHDADGYLTVNYSITMNTSTVFGDASASGSFASTRIPKVPDAPGTPAAAPGITSSSIPLTWSAPADNGGASITAYTLDRATNSGFTTGLVSTALGNVTSYTVSGLPPATTYYFRVRATNSIGTSANSGTRTTATIAAVPSQVTGVGVSNIGPVSADVAWTAPASNGSAITGYRVTRSINASMSGSTEFTDPASPLTLTGLDPSTTYYVRVAAVNAVGSGAWSAVVPFDTVSGVYVSNGTTWRPAGVFVSDAAMWDPCTIEHSNGTAWTPAV